MLLFKFFIRVPALRKSLPGADEMLNSKIGTSRFQGYERFRGSTKWTLDELVRQLDLSISEIAAENIAGADVHLEKFRLARDSLHRLLIVEGRFECIVEQQPASMPILTEWEIFCDELSSPRLEGLVYGHPQLTGYARPICTSLLLHIDEGQGYARTLSRYYRLGRRRGTRCDGRSA